MATEAVYQEEMLEVAMVAAVVVIEAVGEAVARKGGVAKGVGGKGEGGWAGKEALAAGGASEQKQLVALLTQPAAAAAAVDEAAVTKEAAGTRRRNSTLLDPGEPLLPMPSSA